MDAEVDKTAETTGQRSPAKQLRIGHRSPPPQADVNDLQTSASSQAPPRATFTALPLEILAEVLLHTHSPPTVLAVSRTSSYLFRTLALSPAASFIWRDVRKTCKPRPLPEPGDKWRGSEVQYAAFIFDAGICEVCKKRVRTMYVSFATRIRLCSSYHCRKKFIDESLIDVTTEFHDQARRLIWVPYIESTRCLSPMSAIHSNWPTNNAVLLRKTDWERFQRVHHSYTAAEGHLNLRLVSASTSAPNAPGQQSVTELDKGMGCSAASKKTEESEARNTFLENCHVEMERFFKIMSLSVELIEWKRAYEDMQRSYRAQNESWARVLARQEGWDIHDLMSSEAYGSLHRRQTYVLERVRSEDISPIRSSIESQLLEIQARRERRLAEANYEEKLRDTDKIYERIRSGNMQRGSEASTETFRRNGKNKAIVPPLATFRKLPSVRVLKGRPDPLPAPSQIANTSTMADLTSSQLAASLITSDIQTWLVPVRNHLMGLLGFPDGWRSASKLKVDPLERVSARFLCGRCADGGIGWKQRTEECLDFRAVCAHVCTTAKIGGVPEPHVAESSSAEARTVGKSQSKRRSKAKKLDFDVRVFWKDEKAIALINRVLSLLNLSDDDHWTADVMRTMGGRMPIRCLSCTGWIVMDFQAAVGHSHRHDCMQIELLSLPLTVASSASPETMPTEMSSQQLPFSRGLTERLLGFGFRARHLRDKVDYGCRHCLVSEGNVVGGFQGEQEGKRDKKKGKDTGARAMDMNALRSHLKAKHGIHRIRDEDVFCYSTVKLASSGEMATND